MIEFFTDNYKWLFSGAGIIAITFFAKKVFGTHKKNGKAKTSKYSNNNTVTINNNIGSNTKQDSDKTDASYTPDLKAKTRILFVDDEHTKYRMPSILRKTGWKNTKSIKDITDLDDLKVKDADIIFVDINGVGKTLFEDQGLGLASALKKRYPEKKIVIYSAETKGDRFHRALREVDDCLSKDAEPYQFSNLIETLCK